MSGQILKAITLNGLSSSLKLSMSSQSEERPTALRSNIVEKYMRDILNKNNGDDYQQKLKVVRKMHELNMDNRVLNNMR